MPNSAHFYPVPKEIFPYQLHYQYLSVDLFVRGEIRMFILTTAI